MHRRGIRAFLLVMAVSVAAIGCASPPEAEKKAADEAVAAARTAGAEKYAKSEFDAMSEALRTAEADMGAKKYKEAKAAYEKVKALAEEAAKAAAAGHAAMKAEVEKQIGELEIQWQALQTKVEAAVKRAREQKQAWDTSAKEVGETLAAAKSEVDPATAKEKLASVAAAVEKWTADVAAMLAPPAKKKP